MPAINALEWLDENMNRNYPLVDGATCASRSGVLLPSSLLVDLDIMVPAPPESDAASRFFISAVYRSGDSIQIEISYATDGGSIPCGMTPAIPVSIRNISDLAERTFAIAPIQVRDENYAMLSSLTGTLIVGSCIDMETIGTLTFPWRGSVTGDTPVTDIISVRVHLDTEGMHSVTFIDSTGKATTLYNDFTLAAGEGIELSVDTENSSVTISRRATQEELAAPQSVEDVLAMIYSAFGTPIRTINGLPPDSDGNIEFERGDCVDIETGANSITITNPCSQPCCGDMVPDDVRSALKLLQDAVNRLRGTYDSITTNVNTVQSRLSSLIAARN